MDETDGLLFGATKKTLQHTEDSQNNQNTGTTQVKKS